MINVPSRAIRFDYNGVSQLAKETKKPIYLTKDGEGDLVVMDIKAFEEREAILELREMLLATEANRLSGVETFAASVVEEGIRSKFND